MLLETTLTDIIARLRQGRSQNEQTVSQGIVLLILREMGCDIFNTNLVWPEYQTSDSGVFDSCCGSGGMFVQSVRFVKEHATGNGSPRTRDAFTKAKGDISIFSHKVLLLTAAR
jgi:hypothetical protein